MALSNFETAFKGGCVRMFDRQSVRRGIPFEGRDEAVCLLCSSPLNTAGPTLVVDNPPRFGKLAWAAERYAWLFKTQDSRRCIRPVKKLSKAFKGF